MTPDQLGCAMQDKHQESMSCSVVASFGMGRVAAKQKHKLACGLLESVPRKLALRKAVWVLSLFVVGCVSILSSEFSAQAGRSERVFLGGLATEVASTARMMADSPACCSNRRR